MNETFNVQGMTCGHCERAIEQALHRVDPTAQVQIDRAHNTVTVSSNTAERNALRQAIVEEGYVVA